MRWNAKIELVAKALVSSGENSTVAELMRATGKGRDFVNLYLSKLRTLDLAKCELDGPRYLWSPTQKLIEEHKNW